MEPFSRNLLERGVASPDFSPGGDGRLYAVEGVGAVTHSQKTERSSVMPIPVRNPGWKGLWKLSMATEPTEKHGKK
jgi:hypothetical protein